MDTVRKLILEKLVESRLTMSEASIKIGRNHAYLQQFLKRGVPAELGEKERARLAEVIGVPESSLRGPSSPLPTRDYVKLPVAQTHPVIDKTRSGHNLVDTATSDRQLFGARDDLPVFGTTPAGLPGVLIVSESAVDWVARPAPLLRVRDSYGMIVSGDAMAPKLENGSTVLVNPHLPARNGDTCVFRREDSSVMIAQLRRSSDDTWYVRQFSPPKDSTLKRSEWPVCHVTVGSYFGR